MVVGGWKVANPHKLYPESQSTESTEWYYMKQMWNYCDLTNSYFLCACVRVSSDINQSSLEGAEVDLFHLSTNMCLYPIYFITQKEQIFVTSCVKCVIFAKSFKRRLITVNTCYGKSGYILMTCSLQNGTKVAYERDVVVKWVRWTFNSRFSDPPTRDMATECSRILTYNLSTLMSNTKQATPNRQPQTLRLNRETIPWRNIQTNITSLSSRDSYWVVSRYQHVFLMVEYRHVDRCCMDMSIMINNYSRVKWNHN